MDQNVDTAFIRRAVEASDLAALRVALYQATGDAELAEFGPVAALDETDRARLAERAVHLLETRKGGFERRVPSDEEIRKLMDLVLGVPTRDEHFEIRRKFLAFTPFPFQYERPEGAAPVPSGFEVAIIGAGPAGLFAAIKLLENGIKPIICERGKDIESRKNDIGLIYDGINHSHRLVQYFCLWVKSKIYRECTSIERY